LEAAALAASSEENLLRAAKRAKEYSLLARGKVARKQDGPSLLQLAELTYKEMWRTKPPTLAEQLSGAVQPPWPSPLGSGWSQTVLCSFAKLALALSVTGQYRSWILVIEGARGIGKTTYAFNALWQALIDSGLPPEAAKETVAEHFFWDVDEFAKTVLELDRRGVRVPFLVGDDIGQRISKWWVLKGAEARKGYVRVAEALDTIKDVCSLLVVTTPVYEKIASFFREVSDLIAPLEPVYLGGGSRAVAALWYEVVKSVTGRRGTVRKTAEPVYYEVLPAHARMPDDFWQRMMEVRKKGRAERLAAAAEALAEELAEALREPELLEEPRGKGGGGSRAR